MVERQDQKDSQNLALSIAAASYVVEWCEAAEIDPRKSNLARHEAETLRVLLQSGQILVSFDEIMEAGEGSITHGYLCDYETRQAVPNINLDPSLVVLLTGDYPEADEAETEIFRNKTKGAFVEQIRGILERYQTRSQQLRKEGWQVLSAGEWRKTHTGLIEIGGDDRQENSS